MLTAQALPQQPPRADYRPPERGRYTALRPCKSAECDDVSHFTEIWRDLEDLGSHGGPT